MRSRCVGKWIKVYKMMKAVDWVTADVIHSNLHLKTDK